MFPKRILNVDLYILLAQVFLLYQKISCRLKKRWYSAPLNKAHSLGNNEITTFFSQVIIRYIDRVHTYNFPRCNVCFGVNYMGFEEGWTASHKQCNSVNHWKLEKTREVKRTWYCLLHALWWNHGNFAQCKGIRKNFANGTWIPGFWNPEYNTRNPESLYP